MGDDERRLTVCDDVEQHRIAEPGGVVDDRGSGADGVARDPRMERVDGDDDIRSRPEFRDHRQHALSLLVDRDRCAGREGRSADVDPVGAVRDGSE